MKRNAHAACLVGAVFVNCVAARVLGAVLTQNRNSETTPPISRPVDCSLLPDGVYADYQQACRVFYACRDGRQHVFWCLNNTVFNPALGYCDSSTVVRCTPPEQAQTSSTAPLNGVYTDYSSGCRRFYFYRDGQKSEFICPSGTLFDWRTSSCRQTEDVSCSTLSCSDKKDGIYVDHEGGCKRYYDCRGGNKTEHVCPFNKVFNVRTQRCSDPKGVVCRGDEEVFNCNGLPDGYYPDYSSTCRVFYLCLAYRATLYTCSAGTIFSSRHLTCESSQKTQCVKPQERQCADKPNGVFPNYETGCREFTVCQNGMVLHAGACPQGKAINPATGTCQPTPLVTCSPIRDPDCAGRLDGMYPDYGTGCAAYYVCLGRRRILTSYCLGYNLFDLPTQRCLPPSIVACRPPTLSSVLALVDSYQCSGRLGLFPDFLSNCRRYHVCVYGIRETLTCPEDHTFDSITKSCEVDFEGAVCRPPASLAAFGCIPGDEGVYVTEKCHTWHECWSGGGMTFSCPSGMMYRQASGQCESAVTCNQSSPVDAVTSPAIPLPQSVFDCTEKRNGVYPNTENEECDIFHVCAEGAAFSYRCPHGRVFNSEQQSCVIPSGIWQISCSSTTAEFLKNNTNFSCVGKSDGMYADYATRCQRYFICEGGARNIAYCNDGLAFNSQTMMCDERSKTKCGALPLIENENDVSSYSANTASSFPAGKNLSHITSPETTLFQSRIYTLTTAIEDITPSTIIYAEENTFPPSSSTPVTTEPNFQCVPGSTEFYPDYSSGCKQFHICFRMIRKTYTCPSVLLFNPLSQNCDLPENVHCETPESVANQYNCSLKEDGFYPDFSSGCRQYFACMGDKILLYTCPKGRLFNWRTKICDFANAVSCNEIDSVADDTDPLSRLHHKSTASKALEQQSGVPHVHGIPRRFLFDCSDKSDGLYADYVRHCHVFYRCIKGKKISHYCKQGLLFNPKLGICDFEENVFCAPGNTTDGLVR